MSKELIKELKKLMAKWNELGDKYYKQHEEEIFADLKVVWLEKSNGHYKCVEQLRAALLKCGINLEE